jgi:hypothetical protein
MYERTRNPVSNYYDRQAGVGQIYGIRYSVSFDTKTIEIKTIAIIGIVD